ncbi:MAG: hypothetical protein HP032_02585, partial [Oscillospiraceae bacterium]|nr:hypothetical protein [Oscillospiraceae bacterium]
MDNMTLKLGQVQLMVGRDKAENLRRACVLIRRAAEQGAQLVLQTVLLALVVGFHQL